MSSKSSNIVLKIIVLLLIVVVCIYLFLQSSFFAIKKINVTGTENISAETIIDLSHIPLGINIITVNSKLTVRSIQLHPLVLKAELKRHLPSTIEIKITERQAWAVIPYQDKLLLIDRESIYMDDVDYLKSVNYPIITLDKFNEPLHLGQAVNKNAVNNISQLWDKIAPEIRNNISEFHYIDEDASIIFYTLAGTEIRFGGLERLEEKISFLEQILQMEQDMAANGREALAYIDMRFEGQPVLQTR